MGKRSSAHSCGSLENGNPLGSSPSPLEDSHAVQLTNTNSEREIIQLPFEPNNLSAAQKLVEDALIILNVNDSCINSIEILLDKILTHKDLNANQSQVIAIDTSIAEGKIQEIQAVTTDGSNSINYDESCVCIRYQISGIIKPKLAIVHLKVTTNFGERVQRLRFFLAILCPKTGKDENFDENNLAGIIATAFADENFKHNLASAKCEQDFKLLLTQQLTKLAEIRSDNSTRASQLHLESNGKQADGYCNKQAKAGFFIGRGIKEDILRRYPHYISDFYDGIADWRSIQKTISSSVFLYFACLLPTIAFGSLNDHVTNGIIDVKKGILAQAVGQIIFSLFSGQQMNILLTTAPLCLFVKVTHSLAENFDILHQFAEFYCLVGLWCSLFLIIYALFDGARIMVWCTKSTQEIFATFISIAMVVYAFTDVAKNFQQKYWHCEDFFGNGTSSAALNTTDLTEVNGTSLDMQPSSLPDPSSFCHREESLLYLLLMFGTFWFGNSLRNIKNSSFIETRKWEIVSDYALPLAVVAFSIIGAVGFYQIPKATFEYNAENPYFHLVSGFGKLSANVIICSVLIGFCLSVLIFMDQNIGSAIINHPSNKLKKGPAYNWDLLIMALINIILSLFTFPWLHVALPHTPMHVKSLAEMDESVGAGDERILAVRETRLPGIISHILIGLTVVFLLPYPLTNIPDSVLDGLYLFMGITSLDGIQLYERALLFFKNYHAYPPNHYIRHVPVKQVHLYTVLQLIQLVILCLIGFAPIPYVKMLFPIILLLLLVIRQKLVPIIIQPKYLEIMD